MGNLRSTIYQCIPRDASRLGDLTLRNKSVMFYNIRHFVKNKTQEYYFVLSYFHSKSVMFLCSTLQFMFMNCVNKIL